MNTYSMLANKQYDFHDNYSNATVSTEAMSIETSITSCLGTIHVARTFPLFVSANGCPVKSALKKERTTPSRRPKDAKITFSQSVVRRSIMGLDDFSEDELKAYWFRGDEYEAITKSCWKQIQKLDQGRILNDSKYCVRGLESHTRLAGLAKYQNRRAAMDAVLFEQDKQIARGVFYDEPIALRYQGISSSCKLWAIKMALSDQRDAQLIYDDC